VLYIFFDSGGEKWGKMIKNREKWGLKLILVGKK
jgi:hypothetical protein